MGREGEGGRDGGTLSMRCVYGPSSPLTRYGVSRGDSLNTVQGTELSLEEKEEEALEEAREWKAVRTEETAM